MTICNDNLITINLNELVAIRASFLEEQLTEDEIDEVEVEHVGKRTVPSREIDEVDRSDRLGEDAELTDRVAANVATQDVPKEMKDVLIDEMMAERKAKREEFSDAVEGLDDLLDD